jgi:hypothetical protein
MADFYEFVSVSGVGEVEVGWAMGEESRTLVVVNHISEVVSTAVMSFADAHRVMREVNIAVITYPRSVQTKVSGHSSLLRAWISYKRLQSCQ